MKPKIKESSSKTMINKLFKSHYFLISMQFAALLVFVLLIYSAIGITTQDPDFAKILRNTNLSNLIVWSYWWPFIIVTAILFGRFWCSICPMELVTSFVGKFGLKRKPGKILKSGWISTLFYAIIIVVGIHTFAIHRIPNLMAAYMLFLFLVTVAAGLIWEKRTFCTYICPIGHLLGLYSLLSFKELRVIDPSVCKNCKTKSCVSKEKHYNYIGRSCTSELYPAKISENEACILCGQCHKSCTYDNIAIKNRKLATDLFKNIKLTWAEIGFFMIVSGFVVYEILVEWQVTKKIVMAIPNWVNHSLNISDSFTGTIKALILFVLLPFIFYMIFAAIKKVVAKEGWQESFSQLVISILPVTASMHLLKALLKTSSRIPYWNYALADPKGVKTARMLINDPKLLHQDVLFAISPVISISAIFLLIGALTLSLMIIRKKHFEDRTSKMITVFAVLIYSSIFLITLTAWRLF